MDFSAILSSSWFAAGIAGLLAAVVVDYQAFKAFPTFTEAKKYNWGVAIFRAVQGFVVGATAGFFTL